MPDVSVCGYKKLSPEAHMRAQTDGAHLHEGEKESENHFACLSE